MHLLYVNKFSGIYHSFEKASFGRFLFRNIDVNVVVAIKCYNNLWTLPPFHRKVKEMPYSDSAVYSNHWPCVFFALWKISQLLYCAKKRISDIGPSQFNISDKHY